MRRRQSPTDHRAVAARLRAQPGVWQTVGEYRNVSSADTLARAIRTGYVGKPCDPSRWYQPAGAFEARKVPTEDGTLIEARYLGGLAGGAA